MAQEEKWEPFAHVVDDDDDDDDDEALSLSDLPDNLSDNNNNNSSSSSSKPTCNPHTADTPATEFEFRVSFGGETTTAAAASSAAGDMFAGDMCAADEVFFRGQLLPLRPSLSSSSSSCCSSSESALFRSGSLSDSLDRSASSTGLSSRSSSGCVSRSPSSNGGADAAAAAGTAPRLPSPANYLLFALPSPSPQIRRKGGAGGAPPRRSTSSHGPGLFRLGVARAPDLIELRDLRMRSRSHADAAAAAAVRDGKKSLGSSSNSNNSINNSNNINSIGGSFRLLFPGNGGWRGSEQKAAGMRSTRAASFMGRGFGCSCAPDAVEPVSSPIVASSRKKAAAAAAAASPPMKEKEEEEEERRGLKRGESMCRRRILEWMEELSIGKVVVR